MNLKFKIIISENFFFFAYCNMQDLYPLMEETGYYLNLSWNVYIKRNYSKKDTLLFQKKKENIYHIPNLPNSIV